MRRTLIPTVFSDEEFSLRPLTSLASLMENWAYPYSRQSSEVEIYEDDEALFVEAALPGLQADEIKVNLKEGVLYISGQRKEERKNVRTYQKIASKYFYQVALPQPIDEMAKIEAETKDGILKIRLPKARPSKPTKIEVKSS